MINESRHSILGLILLTNFYQEKDVVLASHEGHVLLFVMLDNSRTQPTHVTQHFANFLLFIKF